MNCDCGVRYAGQPGTGRCLGHFDGIDLIEAWCGLDGKRFTRPAYGSVHRLLLPRSGAFLLRVNRQEIFVDSASAVLTRPGDELSVAHPLGCGEAFTAMELRPDLMARLPATHRLPVDDQLDLRHRLLVASCRWGADDLAVSEQVHAILDRLAAAAGTPPDGPTRPATATVHRRLVAAAREALAAARFALGLEEIAALVNCSPHHLSRVFRAVTGETLTAYRNRMRIRAVLADVQDGAGSLRTLAADYGFADQAHLTRAVRRQLGHPPSAVRRMLVR